MKVKRVSDIIGSNNYLRRFAARGFEAYCVGHIHKNIFIHNRKYNNIADPFKYIVVDPNNIKYYEDKFEDIKHTGLVSDGSWDINSKNNKLDDIYDVDGRYKSFQGHFNKGIPWEQTKYYQKKFEEITSGNAGKRDTKEKLDQYLSKIDKLYEDMEENGYRSQQELLQDGDPIITNTTASTPKLKMLIDDIAISIGRDGSYFKCGVGTGRHRIILARILDLDSIAVRVVVRHKKWQKNRDKFSKEGNINIQNTGDGNIPSHPDLHDIL